MLNRDGISRNKLHQEIKSKIEKQRVIDKARTPAEKKELKARLERRK